MLGLENKLKLVIPEEIAKEYNYSLEEIQTNDKEILGYDKQISDLNAVLYNPKAPTGMLLGMQGSGKTSLVRYWVKTRAKTSIPLIVVQLDIERLGELGSDVMVSRMRKLLTNMQIIKNATQEANPGINFQMALFIDEIHKLNNYGEATKGIGEKAGSSGAMNAFKEETAEGVFPVIAATTDYEYRINIKPDGAFDRRFAKIYITQPAKSIVFKILKTSLNTWLNAGKFIPEISDKTLSDLIDYTNAYIYNQANPGKSLDILASAVGLCTNRHLENPNDGWEITHEVLEQVFLANGFRIGSYDEPDINLVIPPDIQKNYNDSLSKMEKGKNTLIGYKEEIIKLDSTMYRPEKPSALLLGKQGIGKTALVEQWIYNRSLTTMPVVVVELNVEKLGTLNENDMISKMKDLLPTLNEIKKATIEANPDKKFQMVLFIDEIHKLYNYGKPDSDKAGSSAAMNALKEGLARAKFPLIGATTDYEYRDYIVNDAAFDRRLGKVIMTPPSLDTTVKILRRRVDSWEGKLDFVPECSDDILREIVKYADAFIQNQVNPDKSLTILDSCVGIARRVHVLDENKGNKITHEIVRQAFLAEDYEIDTDVPPEHIIKVVNESVLGQPLALYQLADVVNTAFYSERNFKRPLFTAFFVGSTGVGKSETAKALAQAFYGRRDAILTLNGGDYATPESSIKAQRFIAAQMTVNKRQVILLDEIEKSHKSVMDMYMRMIDEGIVVDKYGNQRSLNSTVIIATSNLGADIFSDLSEVMHLNQQANPNKLDPRLEEAWWRRESSVRKALQNGDAGLNNGIKPEFLERFSLFVPFLPLARKTMAMIARMQLEKFKQNMTHARYGIDIMLPKKMSHEWWQNQMSFVDTPYGNDDAISVMIAEDLVGSEAKTSGARSITRYIDGSIKTKVTRLLAQRLRHNQPIDGAFKLEAKNASFTTNTGDRPTVEVSYIPVEKL